MFQPNQQTKQHAEQRSGHAAVILHATAVTAVVLCAVWYVQRETSATSFLCY